ncbi:MAG: hypothetical protein AB8B91_11795 [Rubripirellula sp.]
MKPEPSAGSAIAKAYIREMLELNPMWESAKIVRRRRELWIGDEASPVRRSGASSLAAAMGAAAPDVDEQADLRREQRAHRCLEKLQAEFYQIPKKKLDEYIRFLQHERLPEFSAKAKRLAAVATVRDELLQVEQETSDPKFTYSLLQCLVCPASQAGSLKELYIESIIAEGRVKAGCRMVRAFVERHPAIYQLERDWFNLFLDKSNQRLWAKRRSLLSRLWADARQHYVLVAVVCVFVVSPTLRYISREDRKARQTPTTSQEQLLKIEDLYSTEDVQRGMKALEAIQKRNQAEKVSPSQVDPFIEATPSQPPAADDPASVPDDWKAEEAENPFKVVPSFEGMER